MRIAITLQTSEAITVLKHQKQTGDVLQIRPVSCVRIIFSFAANCAQVLLNISLLQEGHKRASSKVKLMSW